jgi:hypothetical protein
MGTDVAKVTTDPRRQYGSVVYQQGRVGLEADSNEASRLAAERLLKESAEIIGLTGTPDDGYRVSAGASPYDLSVKAGTMYVDGLRVFTYDPITYSQQADWIDHQSDPLWRDPAAKADPGLNNEFVYLLLQEHEVGAIEDGALREVALGGPDTCARTKVVQHIVRMGTDKVNCADAIAELQATLAQSGLVPDPHTLDASGHWSGGRLLPEGSMLVDFVSSGVAADPCEPQATGGYVKADNQLVRIKVYSYSAPNGSGSLIWAFDDASFIYRAEVQDAKHLKLATSPVDVFHQPRSGQAVEILRAAARLSTGSDDGPGRLSGDDFVAALDGVVTTLTADYDPDSHLISLLDSIPAEYQDLASNPPFDTTKNAVVFVRVWDKVQQFVSGTFALLGDTGLRVNLSTGVPIHPGSYWMVAVRPTTPTNVYPERYMVDPQPAEGPRSWVCPLAVVSWTGGEGGGRLNPLDDCRNAFDNLVELSKRIPQPTDAWPTVQDIDWPNDQTISLVRFNQGLGVTMSRDMQPDTISEQTFQVALDVVLPAETTKVAGTFSSVLRVPLEVRGTVTKDLTIPNKFTFGPTPLLSVNELQTWLTHQRFYEQGAGIQAAPGLRCRVVLTGDTILDLHGNPLDGEAFGQLQQSATRPYTALGLPSPGDGIKGGDFKSWFFVAIPPRVIRWVPPRHATFPAGHGPTLVDLFFSHPMAMDTVGRFLTVTSSATGPVIGRFTAISAVEAMFQPVDNAGNLQPFADPPTGQSEVNYTVKLDGRGVTDLYGMQLDGDNTGQPGTDFISDFKIVATTYVTQIDPAQTANVAANVVVDRILVTFSGPIDRPSVVAQSITVTDGQGTNVPGVAQWLSSTTAIFQGSFPAPPVKGIAQTYAVTVHGSGLNAIKDPNGVPIAGGPAMGPGTDFTSQFTRQPLVGVDKVDPQNGITFPPGGPRATQVLITFTADVDLSKVDNTNFTVKYGLPGNETNVSGTVSKPRPPSRFVTFIPDAGDFPPPPDAGGQRIYHVRLIGNDVIDAYGSPIAGAAGGGPGTDFTSLFIVEDGKIDKDTKDDKDFKEDKDKEDKDKEDRDKAVKDNQDHPSVPASARRRVRRRNSTTAIGQPFIRSAERPVVGAPSMFDPNP